MSLWSTLDESRRVRIVELFGKRAAESHRHATDVAFEATIQPTKRSNYNVEEVTTHPLASARPEAPLARTESARQFVLQNAALYLSSQPSHSITRTNSFISAASVSSTDGTIGLAEMEEVLSTGDLPRAHEHLSTDKGKVSS